MKTYEIKKPAAMELKEWGMDFHSLMLNDSIRMESFKKAIFEVVKQGDVVCDLGTGTGILSQWALEAGAKRVYGIDFNKKILETAKLNLVEFGERFIPLFGNSLNIQLPEKVDVIISETIGNFADNENCILYLKDAKYRFLKSDGVMIPSNLKQVLVPVHSPGLSQQIEKLDLALNYYETVIPKKDYVADPVAVNQFNFELDNLVEYQKEFSVQLNKNLPVTGFKGWFVAQLSPNIILDTEEVKEDSSWNHCYFPTQEQLMVNGKIKISFQKKESNYWINIESIQ